MKITSVDSQGVDSSPSPALLSEPPDIRNWFPNYKYESFVLDTMDDMGGSTFKESGNEEDGLLVGETNREKEDKFGDSVKNKIGGNKHGDQSITDSLCSPSFSSDSEPPQLGIWFSSYVSESPVLDAVDYFSGATTKDSERKNYGFGIEANSKEKEENFGESRKCENNNEVDAGEKLYSDQSLNCKTSPSDVRGEKTCSEVPDFSESYSFLSEPPNIRNWFPSYVYESPELAESERFFRDENNIEEDHSVDIDRQRRSLHGVVIDNEGPQTTSSMTDGTLEKNLEKVNERVQGKDSFSQDNLNCKREQSLENKIFPEQDISSPGVQKSSLDDEKLSCKEQFKPKFLREADSQSFNSSKKPSDIGKISPTKLICRKNVTHTAETKAQTKADQLSPINDAKFIGYTAFPVRKPNHGSNGKENEGKYSSSNGFVTTKKGKITRPADDRKPENTGGCSRNRKLASADGEKNAVTKRKVLSERTNLEHLEAIEVTGKWKCPQNGKTDVGPPLKQLRLERWVHKI